MSSTADSVTRPARRRTILGGSIGHFIEWYEWSIYGFMAATFAGQMFPTGNETASLIASFSAFAIGFLGRPLGALVLSPLADTYGRRDMLSLTVLLAGLGSLVIGLCPTHEQIGIAAPLLIVAARLLQGFSAGGEGQIATAFLNEHAAPERRALVASPLLVCIGLSVLLASAVAGATVQLLPKDALLAWGWRVPFLLGAAASLYGFAIRRGLHETPAFERVRAQRQEKPTVGSVVAEVMKRPREALLIFVLQMNGVSYYLWLVFLPTYAAMVGGLDRASGLAGSAAALLVYCAFIPAFAHLSDRIGRKPILIASSLCFLLFAYPLLAMLTGGVSAGQFTFVACAGALFIALNSGVVGTVMAELFPTEVRASGIGIPQSVCAALFGGTAPVMATWLHELGGPAYVASYVMAISAVNLVAYLTLLPETRSRSLD